MILILIIFSDGAIKRELSNAGLLGLYLYYTIDISLIRIYKFPLIKKQPKVFAAERLDVIGEKTLFEELDKIIAQLAGIESVDKLRANSRAQVRHQTQLKNNVNERNTIIRAFFRECLVPFFDYKYYMILKQKIQLKRKTKCPRCKRANGEVRNDTGRAVILDFCKLKMADGNQKIEPCLTNFSQLQKRNVSRHRR
jgi:hypothetical protein